MPDFDDPAFLGDTWAGAYADLTFGPDPAQAVEFLAALADGVGRVLELGIGGGRVALPLAARGIPVEGIEASQPVLDRLRATPGGESIPVTIADMADVPVDGPFQLVYLVWSGLYHLPSQARQVDCFRNVARVLAPGGAFVVECFVPELSLFQRGVEVNAVTEGGASMTLTRHDPVAQRIFTQRVSFRHGRRVAAVSGGDALLLAQRAGPDGGTGRAPAPRALCRLQPRAVGSASRGHVSVYSRPGP